MSAIAVGPRTNRQLFSASFQAPAGDVPIRSVSLASDGSCLVAGNNKVFSLICESLNSINTAFTSGEMLCLENQR